jgi:hypothetical protein
MTFDTSNKISSLIFLSAETQICFSLDGFTSHSYYGSFENEMKIFLRQERGNIRDRVWVPQLVEQ